jgi:hypothetical protein
MPTIVWKETRTTLTGGRFHGGTALSPRTRAGVMRGEHGECLRDAHAVPDLPVLVQAEGVQRGALGRPSQPLVILRDRTERRRAVE